ncbi:hypothetical protein ACWDKQ_02085 [Saccharopolyspora sp. NPDC000995]
MPAPTDPAILRERLDGLADLLRDAEPSPSGLGDPLSTSPLPVAALQDHLGNATSWLGRVCAAVAREGAAVRRWLVSEPLGSPIPPQEPTSLPLRKQFRLSLATAALGAGIATAAYTLTAPLADPFFGLIPPGIFSRLPPFAENTAPAPVGEAPVPLPLLNTNPPHDVVVPGLPLVARAPGPPQPPPPPPSTAAAPAPPETGASDGKAGSPDISTGRQDSTGPGAAPLQLSGAAGQQGGVAPAKLAAPPPGPPPEISGGPIKEPAASPQSTPTHQPTHNTPPDLPTPTTTHHQPPQNTAPDLPTPTTTHHQPPQNTPPDLPTRTTTHEPTRSTTADPPTQTAATHQPTRTPEPTPTTTATEPTTDPATPTHVPTTTAPTDTTDRGTS